MDDKTIEKFTSDFKIVAKYFQTKRLKKDYTGSTEIMRHVDETLKMLSSLTGDNSFETVYNENINSENGAVTMCDVVKKIEDTGRDKVIIQLLETNTLTAEQIAAALKLPIETIKEIAQKVPVLK